MDEDRKKQLRKTLDEFHTWPSAYMFKFVLPAQDKEKAKTLRGYFGETAEFRERLSSKGTYLSITVREIMLNADAIFERYEKASSLKGIIAL